MLTLLQMIYAKKIKGTVNVYNVMFFKSVGIVLICPDSKE